MAAHKDTLTTPSNLDTVFGQQAQLQSQHMHAAMQSGDNPEAIVELIIYGGMPTRFRDINGDSMLHLAVRYGHIQMVSMMVKELRIPINAINHARKTPLDVVNSAASRIPNAKDMIALLKEHGAVGYLSYHLDLTSLLRAEGPATLPDTSTVMTEDEFAAIHEEDSTLSAYYLAAWANQGALLVDEASEPPALVALRYAAIFGVTEILRIATIIIPPAFVCMYGNEPDRRQPFVMQAGDPALTLAIDHPVMHGTTRALACIERTLEQNDFTVPNQEGLVSALEHMLDFYDNYFPAWIDQCDIDGNSAMDYLLMYRREVGVYAAFASKAEHHEAYHSQLRFNDGDYREKAMLVEMMIDKFLVAGVTLDAEKKAEIFDIKPPPSLVGNFSRSNPNSGVDMPNRTTSKSSRAALHWPLNISQTSSNRAPHGPWYLTVTLTSYREMLSLDAGSKAVTSSNIHSLRTLLPAYYLKGSKHTYYHVNPYVLLSTDDDVIEKMLHDGEHANEDTLMRLRMRIAEIDRDIEEIKEKLSRFQVTVTNIMPILRDFLVQQTSPSSHCADCALLSSTVKNQTRKIEVQEQRINALENIVANMAAN